MARISGQLNEPTQGVENDDSAKGRNYSGLSQTERKAQRKQQFLQAGMRLFGTIGFRSTTVRAVCKEAKLTDRYFYESFGNLEKLAMAVYENCMTSISRSALEDIVKAYALNNDPVYAIEAGLDTFFKALEEPCAARICMVELEGVSPEVDTLYNSYINNFARIFIALADKAFPAWQASEDEKWVIAIGLVGVLRQTATTWLMNDYDKERSALVSGSTQLFVGIIRLIETKINSSQ